MTAAFSAHGLCRSYGDRKAVQNLDLVIPEGERYALLGRNGAGKTTAFSLLSGLLAPDAGELRVGGQVMEPGDRRFRRRLGVVFQTPATDKDLTARQNLHFAGALYSIPTAELTRRIDDLTTRFGIHDRLDEAVKTYSGGMRQRLEICRALLHEPAILLLDEPTQGLDEAGARGLFTVLDELQAERTLSVALTTHRMSDAERCHRVGLMHGGRLVAEGSPAELRARVGGGFVVLEGEDHEAVREGLAELGLAATPWRSPRGDALRVVGENPHALIPRIVEAFPPGRFSAVTLQRPTLGDAFLALTGASLAEDASDESDSRPATRPVPDRGLSFQTERATIGVLLRREVRKFAAQRSRVSAALFQPLVFWLLLGTGMAESFQLADSAGLDYRGWFYPGVVAMVVLFSSIFSSVSVIEDRQRGFLQMVMAGPGSRGALVLGKALGAASVALVQGALLLALAPLAGFDPFSFHWPFLVLALAGTATWLATLGFCFAWMVDSSAGYHAVMSIVLFPMWMLSGALFPVGEGGWLAWLMRANPLSWSLALLRRGIHGGVLPGPALPGGAAAEVAVTLLAVVGTAGWAAWIGRRR